MKLSRFSESHKRSLIGVASFLIILAIWELIGQLGKFNPLFFSWPSSIAREFYKITINGELYKHLLVSFLELFFGYTLACTAIPIGIIIGRIEILEYILDPIFSALYAIPRVAIMPVIIVILGIGIPSKIFLVFFGCFFPILINVFQGTKNIDQLTVDMARSFGAKGWKLFNHILFPSILPYLMAGFRISLSIGLIMVVVAEFFVGSEGIGYKIAYESGFFRASSMMAWVLVISIISIFFTELIKYFENKMRKRWYGHL